MKKFLSSIKITKQDVLIGVTAVLGMILTKCADDYRAEKEEAERQEETRLLVQEEVAKQLAER